MLILLIFGCAFGVLALCELLFMCCCEQHTKCWLFWTFPVLFLTGLAGKVFYVDILSFSQTVLSNVLSTENLYVSNKSFASYLMLLFSVSLFVLSVQV